MNWDTLKGNWNQYRQNFRQQFNKLTDDDFNTLGNDRDKIIGRIQERYGYNKDEAQRRFDDWCNRVGERERV